MNAWPDTTDVLSVFFTDSNNKRKAKQPETATIDNFPDNSPVATIAAHSTDLDTPENTLMKAWTAA